MSHLTRMLPQLPSLSEHLVIHPASPALVPCDTGTTTQVRHCYVLVEAWVSYFFWIEVVISIGLLVAMVVKVRYYSLNR